MSIKTSSLCLASMLAVSIVTSARADLIAGWTFQTAASTNNIIGAGLTPSATQSGVLADLGTGTGSATHASAATVWSIPAGNGSANSWSANTWSTGDFFQFTTTTLGYTGTTVSFDMTRSGTGPGQFQLNFSPDGVNFFVLAPVNVLTNGGASGLPSWNSATGNAGYSFLFSVPMLDNLPIASIKLLDVNPTGAPAGTVRIDNFMINGTVVPEPTSLAIVGLGLLGRRFVRRKH